MTRHDPSEEAFIERLRGRDERAFNELVELYGERVYRLVYRMLGRREEAEDMAQEVFVQVFKAVDQFRGDAQLGTWIYRIAVNTCKNRKGYLARRPSESQPALDNAEERSGLGDARGLTAGELERPDHLVEGYQVETIVKESIATMDPEFREVLVLRDVEALSYEEITQITGLAEGTVKSRLHRARSALRQAVERRLGEKLG